jgi:dihydrofolate reductase
MVISAIVAVAKNGVIGKEGQMPWYLPAELAHFKKLTMGHPIIMGRITHESIGRALPGRTNIVITRSKGYRAKGCKVAGSFDRAVEMAKRAEGADEIFIIGGEQIYQKAMPLLNRIYLTKVYADVEGDKFFYYNPREWRQVARKMHYADDKNHYDFEFILLQRKNK